MSDRIDKMMVEKALVKTRSQARMLIVQGDVYCNDKLVSKPGQNVSESDNIEIRNRSLFVSRGAYKLEKALNEFAIDPIGKICADIGASTGGFTQLLLQRNAAKVYCVDVGHDQLAQELKEDPRVINLEGTNIKYPLELEDQIELAVVDLSFISIRLVFENIFNLLSPTGEMVILIKPQFEVGKERIGKGGLVSDEDRAAVILELKEWFNNAGVKFVSESESPIKGNKSGNVEFLWHLKKEIKL